MTPSGEKTDAEVLTSSTDAGAAQPVSQQPAPSPGSPAAPVDSAAEVSPTAAVLPEPAPAPVTILRPRNPQAFGPGFVEPRNPQAFGPPPEEDEDLAEDEDAHDSAPRRQRPAPARRGRPPKPDGVRALRTFKEGLKRCTWAGAVDAKFRQARAQHVLRGTEEERATLRKLVGDEPTTDSVNEAFRWARSSGVFGQPPAARRDLPSRPAPRARAAEEHTAPEPAPSPPGAPAATPVAVPVAPVEPAEPPVPLVMGVPVDRVMMFAGPSLAFWEAVAEKTANSALDFRKPRRATFFPGTPFEAKVETEPVRELAELTAVCVAKRLPAVSEKADSPEARLGLVLVVTFGAPAAAKLKEWAQLGARAVSGLLSRRGAKGRATR